MLLIKNDYERGKIKLEDLLDTVKRRLEEYNIKNNTI